MSWVPPTVGRGGLPDWVSTFDAETTTHTMYSYNGRHGFQGRKGRVSCMCNKRMESSQQAMGYEWMGVKNGAQSNDCGYLWQEVGLTGSVYQMYRKLNASIK